MGTLKDAGNIQEKTRKYQKEQIRWTQNDQKIDKIINGHHDLRESTLLHKARAGEGTGEGWGR